MINEVIQDEDFVSREKAIEIILGGGGGGLFLFWNMLEASIDSEGVSLLGIVMYLLWRSLLG